MDSHAATSTCRSILIALGPTAGHVQRALVFADEYRAVYPEALVHFAGPSTGPAVEFLATRGLVAYPVRGAPLANAGLRERMASVARTLAGIIDAFQILRHTHARLVVGFGGHTSGSIVLAARATGLRSVVHEANVIPGTANSWLARVVDRIYLGSSAAAHRFPTSKVLVVGNLVRAKVALLATASRRPPDRMARILVLSGTGGAPFLAAHVPALVADIARGDFPVTVHHQCGELDPSLIASQYASLGVSATVERFVSDLVEAYRSADLVIARAGAGTIAELAAAALPAVLVPLSTAAADHQTANALAYASTGAAIAVREGEWNQALLARRIRALLQDACGWLDASAAARAAFVPDAARRMVLDCEARMSGYW